MLAQLRFDKNDGAAIKTNNQVIHSRNNVPNTPILNVLSAL
jgi:hypothetical protein